MSNKEETLQISAGSLHEFAEAVQNGVLLGYRVDIDNADHFPQMIGWYFHAIMVKRDKPLEVVKLASFVAELNTEKLSEDIQKIVDVSSKMDLNEEQQGNVAEAVVDNIIVKDVATTTLPKTQPFKAGRTAKK